MMIVTGDNWGSLRFIYVLSNFPNIGILLIVQLRCWDFSSVDQAIDLLALLNWTFATVLSNVRLSLVDILVYEATF